MRNSVTLTFQRAGEYIGHVSKDNSNPIIPRIGEQIAIGSGVSDFYTVSSVKYIYAKDGTVTIYVNVH